MKKIIFFIIFSLSTLPAWAQTPTKTKTFEIGMDALSMGYTQTIQDPISHNRALQYFSGLFLRYNLPKFSARVGIHYNRFESTTNNKGCYDCYRVEQNVRFMALSVGAQHNLLRARDWLYAFADVRYMDKKQQGTQSGGITGVKNYFEHKTKGISLLTGVGVRAILFRYAVIGSEFSLEAGRYSAHTPYAVLSPAVRILLSAKF